MFYLLEVEEMFVKGHFPLVLQQKAEHRFIVVCAVGQNGTAAFGKSEGLLEVGGREYPVLCSYVDIIERMGVPVQIGSKSE